MKIRATLPGDGWHAIVRRRPPQETLPPFTMRLISWALIDLDDHDLPQLVGMILCDRGGVAVIPVLDHEGFLGYWDGYGNAEEAIAQALAVIVRQHHGREGDDGEDPPEDEPPPDPPQGRHGRLPQNAGFETEHRGRKIPPAFRNAWA